MLIRSLLFYFMAVLLPLQAIPITLEHASTPREISWGLMGRNELPPDHGMMFSFPTYSIVGVWMFNCYMDLSVAFLDKNSTIIEIHELKAFPQKMDPKRPVRSVEDLKKYPSQDPIVKFFKANAIYSKSPAKYMLEMPKQWFANHNIHVGDRILWDPSSTRAEVLKI